MTQDGSDGNIYVDSNWKEEAAREKERLAQEEAKPAGKEGGKGGASPAMFMELVNVLATQAAIGLGGYQAPTGEVIPPNVQLARFHIDLLAVLSEKTEGNLSTDEKTVLDRVLHDLRMEYVKAAGPEAGVGTPSGNPTDQNSNAAGDTSK